MKQAIFLLLVIGFVCEGPSVAKADNAEMTENVFYGNLALFVQPFSVQTLIICASGNSSEKKCEKITHNTKVAEGNLTVFKYNFAFKSDAIHLLSVTVDGQRRGYTVSLPTAPAAIKKTDKKSAYVQTMVLMVLSNREVKQPYALISLWPNLDGARHEEQKVSTEEETSFDMNWQRGNCAIPNSQGIPLSVSFHPVPNLNQ